MTGFLCFVLFVAGALLAMLSGLSKKHRRGIETAGHLLISVCFFTYALVSSHVLRVSPRPVVTGTVVEVRPKRSRMDTNLFTLKPDGRANWLTVHSEYSAPQVQAGSRIRVQYSDYDNGVLEMDVLSGPGRGFVMHESDSAAYHLLFLLGGFIFLGTTYVIWRKKPKVTPSVD